MDLSFFASKKVAILGMGIEGRALIGFLMGKCQSLTLLDKLSEQDILQRAMAEKDNKTPELLSNSGLIKKLGVDYLKDLNEFDIIYRSPGIKFLLPELQAARNEGVEISSQIKLFFDLCPCKIIGVTGTKGKGTTSTLIYNMLKKNAEILSDSNSNTNSSFYVAGNIGVTAIDLIPKIKKEDIVILELSSFQLQDLHKSPNIALVLNISVDHLDYHENVNEYRQAKTSIVSFQKPSDIAIVNMDYLTSFEFASLTRAEVYYFSGRKSVDFGAYVRLASNFHDDNMIDVKRVDEVVLRFNGEENVICRSDEVLVPGKHNLENIAAASIAAASCGCSVESISAAAREFQGLPHRLELVPAPNGVRVYNDSFSTNPEPTIAAVHAFDEPKILILGGSTKGADFSEMAREIAASNTLDVILIGEEAEKINIALRDNNFLGDIINVGCDFEQGVKLALERALDGAIVIFSPGCASFDMFKNYKDRGERFKEIVLSLTAVNPK